MTLAIIEVQTVGGNVAQLNRVCMGPTPAFQTQLVKDDTLDRNPHAAEVARP